MRLRNVRGSREKIAANEYVVQEPEQYKGKWNELFKNSNPIHIEVGMGKGQFIMQLAEQNPDINYIGIEKFSSVLVRALEKREQVEMDNLFFIRMDAERLPEVFEKDEVARIYLNFSDPWPKDRHAKRRLTSKEFLARYDQLLIADGRIIFKTDNRELFDFSLEQTEEAGWILERHSYDLHHSEWVEGNVMTEYEQRFVEQGKSINYMMIYREK